MNKEFTSREKGMIKNTARSVYPMYEKLLKMEEQLEKQQLAVENQRNLINQWEQGVMNMTGGYTSTELIAKKMITVGEGDKAVRKAAYEFRYGDAVLPPEETVEQNTVETTCETNNNPTI